MSYLTTKETIEIAVPLAPLAVVLALRAAPVLQAVAALLGVVLLLIQAYLMSFMGIEETLL